MKYIQRLFCLFLVLISFEIIAQTSQPLDREISLAGNYGELRGGRFHAGLDFRVGGRVGDSIKAFRDGYVYRLSVSSCGYGNGIYLRHKDGSFSIYGHLYKYASKLQKLVKDEQYRKESFYVDIYLDSLSFPVKRGDVIGYVGNSGSSAAPHLHFELRDKDNAGPINPIQNAYIKVEDNIPPVFRQIRFYSYEQNNGEVNSTLIHSFKYGSNKTLILPERSFVAIDAYDRQDGTTGKLAVSRYSVFLDEEKIYSYSVQAYQYKDMRYFNSLISYPAKVDGCGNMIKSYVEPGNRLVSKIQSINDGLIVLSDDNEHVVSVVLEDEFANTSVKKFRVKRGDSSEFAQMPFSQSNYIAWYLPFIYKNDELIFTLPAGSLYNSTYFTIDSLSRGEYSSVWRIHRADIPIGGKAFLKLSAKVPTDLVEKAFIAKVSDEGNMCYCGGTYKDAEISAKISSFGNYTVAIDTTAPKIVPRFRNENQISRSGQFAFTIKDDLSGIRDFRVEIDGRWVLAQYDEKYDKLWVMLDERILRTGSYRDILVSVRDRKNNINTYKFSIKW